MSVWIAATAGRLGRDRRGISSLEYAVLCAMMLALTITLAGQLSQGLIDVVGRMWTLAGV